MSGITGSTPQTYRYASKKIGADAIKTVDIAPASATVHGEYTLTHNDGAIALLNLGGATPPPNIVGPDLTKNDPLGHALIQTYLNPSFPMYEKIKDQLSRAIRSAVRPAASDSNGAFTVTLVWDGFGDVDLHVTEPSGAHVYHDAPEGSAGKLDRNNRTADGPEHYAASCDVNRLAVGRYDFGINNFSGAEGRKAIVQASTSNGKILATKTLDVGRVRGPDGNRLPIPALSVFVSKNADGSIDTKASKSSMLPDYSASRAKFTH